jgi:polyisoprenoid-binding protein YceI
VIRLEYRVCTLTLALALLVPFLALATGAQSVAAEAWKVDANHSQVSFVINHFSTPVRGTFDEYKVELVYDPANPAASSLSVEIPVASINTSNQRRDDHLRSPDWFEAEKFPVITFASSSVEAVDDTHLIAHGTLTIKGISHEIALEIERLGLTDIPAEMQRSFGKRVASFKATATIDRNDYEVGVGSWASTAVVGDQVGIEIVVEAHQG